MKNKYQEKITNVILDAVGEDSELDIDECGYITERTVSTGWHGRNRVRNDLVLELKYKTGHKITVCIEIKSSQADLFSGCGLNFNEEFNFLAFRVGRNNTGEPIRMKHIAKAGLKPCIGILVVLQDDTLICLRPAFSTKNNFAFPLIYIGENPISYIEKIVDIEG